MDNILKKMIRDEMDEYLRSKNFKSEVASTTMPPPGVSTTSTSENNELSSSIAGSSRSGNAKNTKRKTETRLGGLLSKIRNKGTSSSSTKNNNTSVKKTKKLQLKWSRYVSEKADYELVKPKDNGGDRFIKLEEGISIDFETIKEKAIELYFDNKGFNSFLEHRSECLITLEDHSHHTLKESDDLWNFMDSKGIYLSKCVFTLTSKHRETCNVSTFEYSQQDDEFKDSLESDQYKNTTDSNVIEEATEDVIEIDDDEKKYLKSSPSSFEDTVKELSISFLEQEEFVTFQIRRRCLYQDVLKKMRIFFENKPLRKVKVVFSSAGSKEAGIDTGGPGREMVSLFYDACVGKLLQGDEQNYSFIHDLTKTTEFYLFGKFVVLALLHGYESPHSFCKGLASYILGESECKCDVEDIPDFEVKEKVLNISKCEDEASFKLLINDFPERFALGCVDFAPAFTDKENIVKTTSHHCIISSTLEEIKAFTDGLSSNNTFDILKEFKTDAVDLFTHNKTLLNAEKLKELFLPLHSTEEIKYNLEEDIVFNWLNFLDEIDNSAVKAKAFTLEHLESGITNENQKVEKTITISDVIRFVTGARFLSKQQQRITIQFDHCNSGRMTTSTCNDKITIPVTNRYTDGKLFTNNIVADIFNSPGFGQT